MIRKKQSFHSSIAIRLIGVTKQYTLHHEKPTPEEKFLALNNVSLEIKKGEHVGIVGPNGSGKTTLLKIISGITKQADGVVLTQGKIASLIDLEAGFQPDLTGKENIFLNGMLM